VQSTTYGLRQRSLTSRLWRCGSPHTSEPICSCFQVDPPNSKTRVDGMGGCRCQGHVTDDLHAAGSLNVNVMLPTPHASRVDDPWSVAFRVT
jgi:hypothetical protein